MQILNKLTNTYFKSRLKRLEKFSNSAAEVQQNQLLMLLNKGRKTIWGEKYGYKHFKTIADYQSAVPISTYESFYPYIHRVLSGEENVLWPGHITTFSKSSGTTNNKSKYIPVSKEALYNTHFQGGKDTLTLYLSNYTESHFLSGKTLTIVGTTAKNVYNSRAICGDISAILAKELPIWAALKRIPNTEITMIENWEEKIEKIVQTYATADVRSLAGVPTWVIVILDRLCQYMGKTYVDEIWQNLEVFFHGAVAFEPYRQTFHNMIANPNMRYMEIYNASEGCFGIQDRIDDHSMLLMLDYGIFYEFVPIEYIHEEHPKVLILDQVQLGKIYAMVITTNAGLWRYAIGDTIRFTHKNPYRFKIVGRTKNFINAFGEEVVIENVEQALAQACEQTGAQVSEFTVAPAYLSQTEKGRHEWIIEFVVNPNNLDHFIHILDETLKNLNSDYQAKRSKNLALLEPIVNSVPSNTFYKWFKKNNRLGGQYKVPRLCNNRTILEDIMNSL